MLIDHQILEDTFYKKGHFWVADNDNDIGNAFFPSL